MLLKYVKIEEILPHENANRLEIARVLGWYTIVPKGEFQAGDRVVFFPPETVLPVGLAEVLGVTPYLKTLPQSYPNCQLYAGRVSAANLRGAKSYGFVAHVRTPWRPHLNNLDEFLGVQKYSPPEPRNIGGRGFYGKRNKVGGLHTWLHGRFPLYRKLYRRSRFYDRLAEGSSLLPFPGFELYHKLPHLRNHPSAFKDGGMVVVSEKIHGTNSAIGYVEGQFMAASHNLRRKHGGLYWKPFELYPELMHLLGHLAGGGLYPVVVYGEIYGPGIQTGFDYGLNGPGYRVFDIKVGGEFLTPYEVEVECYSYNIPRVPVVYEGEFSWSMVEARVSGLSMVPGAEHMREGIVIRARTGGTPYRVISHEYLSRKGGSENH